LPAAGRGVDAKLVNVALEFRVALDVQFDELLEIAVIKTRVVSEESEEGE